MGKIILIVDDSATVRQQLRLALGPAGYDIVEASDGQEGLDLITSRSDLSMVICDVNMPRMSGIEMLQALPSHPSPPPVVMLTTEGRPELIRTAKAAGAKGWIIKPFNADLLLMAVAKLAA